MTRVYDGIVTLSASCRQFCVFLKVTRMLEEPARNMTEHCLLLSNA